MGTNSDYIVLGYVDLKVPFLWNMKWLTPFIISPENPHNTAEVFHVVKDDYSHEGWIDPVILRPILQVVENQNGEKTRLYCETSVERLLQSMEPLHDYDPILFNEIRKTFDPSAPMDMERHYFVTAGVLRQFRRSPAGRSTKNDVLTQLLRLPKHKILQVRHSSLLHAANGDVRRLTVDVETSSHISQRSKIKVITELYDLWKRVKYMETAFTRHRALSYLSRYLIESEMHQCQFSENFRDLYRRACIAISSWSPKRSEEHMGEYHVQGNRALIRKSLDSDERIVTSYHEVGHGFSALYSYGLNAIHFLGRPRWKAASSHRLIHQSAPNRTSKRHQTLSKTLKTSLKPRDGIEEAFAFAFELLCCKKSRPYHEVSDMSGFSKAWVELNDACLRANAATAILMLNSDSDLLARTKLPATPEPLASSMSMRFGQLLHSLFPEMVRPLPPDIRRQVQRVSESIHRTTARIT